MNYAQTRISIATNKDEKTKVVQARHNKKGETRIMDYLDNTMRSKDREQLANSRGDCLRNIGKMMVQDMI